MDFDQQFISFYSSFHFTIHSILWLQSPIISIYFKKQSSKIWIGPIKQILKSLIHPSLQAGSISCFLCPTLVHLAQVWFGIFGIIDLQISLIIRPWKMLKFFLSKRTLKVGRSVQELGELYKKLIPGVNPIKLLWSKLHQNWCS